MKRILLLLVVFAFAGLACEPAPPASARADKVSKNVHIDLPANSIKNLTSSNSNLTGASNSPIAQATPVTETAPVISQDSYATRSSDPSKPRTVETKDFTVVPPAPVFPPSDRILALEPTLHPNDRHHILQGFVIDNDGMTLGESLEMHDYDSDGTVDAVIYYNVVDVGHDNVWVGGWWRGSGTSTWFKKMGVPLSSPLVTESEVGYLNVDTFFKNSANLEFVSAPGNKEIQSLFDACDGILRSSLKQGIVGKKQGMPVQQSDYVMMLMGFLEKRESFPAIGAKCKRYRDLKQKNMKLLPPIRNMGNADM